jgi:hypothetical protein
MLLAMDFRRQAQVCARLAEDCGDRRLAKRFRKISAKMSALSLPPNLPQLAGSGWQTRNLIRGVKAGLRGVGGCSGQSLQAASPLAPSHSAATDRHALS